MSFIFNKKTAELYVPDGVENGLSRVTKLCIAAHQDDVEIMAYAPIADCYENDGEFFGAVTVTDGAGSPRTGKFASCSDEDMKKIRIEEQKSAARIGKYGALMTLSYQSSEVKADDGTVAREIARILLACRPREVYTHNLADKHPTHVATALRTLEALALVKDEYRAERVVGLEVWRSLDWLPDSEKLLMDTSAHPELAKALLDVYESQIAGGKSYDLAAIGRRYANATFFESHSTDGSASLSYGLDMTALAYSDKSPEDYIGAYIDSFKYDVITGIRKLKK